MAAKATRLLPPTRFGRAGFVLIAATLAAAAPRMYALALAALR